MGKIYWKLRHYSNGIFISVIILLFFLTFAGGQRFNRRGAGFHRRGYVDYQARNQYRPEQLLARDRRIRNRIINTPRQDNINTVNDRIQRLEYLRKQRAHIETKIDRHNAQLRQEMYSDAERGSSARRSRTLTGRDSVLESRRTGSSVNGDIVQRRNYVRPAYETNVFRNNGHNNQRTASAQNSRAAVVVNSRQSNNYVRPRDRVRIKDIQRDTVRSGKSFNGYSPLLNRRVAPQSYSPLVQTTEYSRRNLPNHFKPFSSNYLRQFSAKSDRTRDRKYYPFIRSSSSGHVTARQVHPTRQSFPNKPIVYQIRDRGNAVQSQNIVINSLDAPAHLIQVEPTKGTLVPRLETAQTGGNFQKVLLPLPSVQPAQVSSNTPLQVLRRTELPNGDTILKVVPVSKLIIPAIRNKVQTVNHVQRTEQNLATGPQTVQQPGVSTHITNNSPDDISVPKVTNRKLPISQVGQQVSFTSNAVHSNILESNAVHASVVLPTSNQQHAEVPNTVRSTKVHSPNVVQSNIQVPITVKPNLLDQSNVQTIQPNVVVPNPVKSNVHVPNIVQSNINAIHQPNVHVPNTVNSNVHMPNNYPISSWLSHLLLSREQPDSPDPTEAVKTVTELVNILSSVVPDAPATGEEEEIEWEDLPPVKTTTTTTTTTMPLPPTVAPTTPATNVIKSIAERIVSLLVQRNGDKRKPKAKIQQQIGKSDTVNAHVKVKPTLQPLHEQIENTVPAGHEIGNVFHLKGAESKLSLLQEPQPTFPALRPSVLNQVIATHEPQTVVDIALARLASHPTIRSILQKQVLTKDLSQIGSKEQLELNDVILSDSLPHTRAESVADGVALAPYMSSNDLGGLSVKKIDPVTNESGTKGNKNGSVKKEQDQGQLGDIAVKALLDKIKRIVVLQDAPITTPTPTSKAPTTLAPTTPAPMPLTPAPSFASAQNTCKPGSPNFRCRGKDMFQVMESIGAWCIGMCFKRGCINTVCTCGCNLPSTQMTPSAMPLTPTQRRQILNSFGSPAWEGTTQSPTTTEEPPEEEEEEWEPEDGTTTKVPTTTLNPWRTLPWDGNSPSPQSDFRLNPIDQHSSDAHKIGQHVSEISDIAWASEIKSRLSQLAAAADNSTNADSSAVGWNKDKQTSSGSKAPPNWKGTEWHLQTPPPKKPPPTPETNAARSNTWQRRPLRDKWGRSERFTGGGESQSVNNPGWNMWNNPWQMNTFGNMFGGDSRLNRFRFNWGRGSGSSGSGGEENEAAD